MKTRIMAALAALTLLMGIGTAAAETFVRTRTVREAPAASEPAAADEEAPVASEPAAEAESWTGEEASGAAGEPAAEDAEAREAAAAEGTEEAAAEPVPDAWPAENAFLVKDENPADDRIARDISANCTFNGSPGGPKNRLNDGVYAYVYKTGPRDGGIHSVEIAVTEGEPMGALYVQWWGDGVPAAVQIRVGEEWRTVVTTDGDFFADYIRIPECYECRLLARDNPKQQLTISELTVLTSGTPADNIQVWQKPEGKMDLMLLSCHPDDELLWFGGTIPYYAGEKGKKVLVVCCALNINIRKLELCDALWACGVRIHPIYMHRLDVSAPMQDVLAQWQAEYKVLDWVTGYIRQYQPDVLLLHDVNGEYGHGAHRAASWIGRKAFEQAQDPGIWPESAALYGTWEVPKVYIHLWEENQIRMDWHQPLERFGGKTALDVAAEALEFHKSQTQHGWKMSDGGEHDNALFGLYHTSVGPDTEKNDFFENIKK